MKNSNPFAYQNGMIDIKSDILKIVLDETSKFEYKNYTKDDVFKALNSRFRTQNDLKALLSIEAGECLEEIAEVCKNETRAKFGENINIFTPFYISNFCDSHCVYCGFNTKNSIKRAKLSFEAIKTELINIKKTGLEEILILTGESRANSDVEYIAKACKMASQYFKVVGVEIYPLNVDEYAFLHENGVDYVNVYQETYNPSKYQKIHLLGEKMSFIYRFNSQERAIIGGMRGVGFGALLGIDDFRKDAFATVLHANLIYQKYPFVEISLSVPRLRPVINNSRINPRDVHEKELLQVVMAYRLFMPHATITISTRERAGFRDNAIKIAANKLSAGVSVGIGGHSKKIGDEQFNINDERSVDEVCKSIENNGFYPLMSEYIYV